MTNPAPASFKQLIKSGAIKRADAMKIPYKDLHIEPGFNERDRTADFGQSVRELADYILSGGTYPPLECRVADDGKVFVVDGHRRHEAIGLAIKAGAPIEWVDIRQFVGNDADRVARIVTSAQGRPLSPLETSRVYKRLQGFGLSPADIAKKVSRSLQHVNELLTLANANTDVQKHVSEGAVSAKNAAALVRQHGERAGAVLDDKLQQAKAEGKKKVTAKSLAPRSTPPQEPPPVEKEKARETFYQAMSSGQSGAQTAMPPEPSDNMVAAGVRAVRAFQRSDECRVMAEQEAITAGVRAAYSAMYREFTETGA